MPKKLLTLIFSTIISVSAFYFAFRKVPFAELMAYLTKIDYFWIPPSVIIICLAFVIRALRWKIILGDGFDLNFWQAYHPMMIGFMINLILPGRVGEIARPTILTKKENVPFSTGFASVISERLFDLILLLLLFIITSYCVDISPDLEIVFGTYHLNKATLISIQEGMTILSIILMAGILLISVNATRSLIVKALEIIPSLCYIFPESLKHKIKDLIHLIVIRNIENIASGFSFLMHPYRFGICFGLSAIIWGLIALSYYILALGCPGIDLSIFELSAVMVIVCFFIALPSVPGFWGLWEAGGIFALTLFNVPVQSAAGYTLTNHLVQLMPIFIAGLLSAILYSINIFAPSKDILEEKQLEEHSANII